MSGIQLGKKCNVMGQAQRVIAMELHQTGAGHWWDSTGLHSRASSLHCFYKWSEYRNWMDTISKFVDETKLGLIPLWTEKSCREIWANWRAEKSPASWSLIWQVLDSAHGLEQHWIYVQRAVRETAEQHCRKASGCSVWQCFKYESAAKRVSYILGGIRPSIANLSKEGIITLCSVPEGGWALEQAPQVMASIC